MEYTVITAWDEEADVWIATSNDIPGLVLESGSLDVLMERIRFAVPDLLELNGIKEKDITLVIRSEKHQQVYA